MLELCGELCQVETRLTRLRKDALGLGEVGVERATHVPVVGERAQRLLRHGVDHAGRDQPLDIEQVRIAMYIVGGVEIVAGLVVFVSPRLGGLLVASWLAGIIVSLLLVGGYGDIALRDFGLVLAALTLAWLASAFSGRTLSEGRSR